jgi:tetratricopeptide (TPR) repeat protein
MVKMKIYFTLILTWFATIAGSAQSRRADSLTKALQKAKQPVERFDLLNRIAEDYYTTGKGNVDSSLCIQMLRIAEQLKSDSLLAIAYNLVGGYFVSSSGDYSRALEVYFKAVPLAENGNDKRRLSSLYIDIAVIYFKLNNPAQQIKYLRKAWENLPDQRAPKYYYMLRQVQYNMGRYYLSQNMPDSALHYAQALNETNLYLKSPVVSCTAQGLLGRIYDQFGDKELAELNFRRADKLADSIQLAYLKFDFKPVFIDFLINIHKVPEASALSRQLMQLGIQYQNFDVRRAAAGFIRRICDIDHLVDSAYYYCRLELAMKDSVSAQNNVNKIISLAFNEQLRTIEEQGKLAEQVAQRRVNLQYGLIAIGIISFLTLFLVLSRSIITNRKAIQFLGVIVLLIVFEFINLFLHPIIDQATNHSPILMLLALVCIAALLVPSHYKIEKWALSKIIEKNEMIRLSAAKKTVEKLEGRGSHR